MWRTRGGILLATAMLLSGNQMGRSKPVVVRAVLVPAAVDSNSPIWMVEETSERLLYSNGLSVSRAYETESVGRRYRSYRRDSLKRSDAILSEPVGIVFHTTESEIFAFEPAQNQALIRGRESVLEHVRNGRSYNFVIDRFGQVYRIVPETETALHAGHSIWASEDTVWVDLNESFLGVSFEAESAGSFQPSAAQLHAGRLLTDVLRAKYGIPQTNCVTHAQVSVNPDNMRIGYHTDWGSSFPFAEVGVTQGYRLPVAAVAVFGFEHDDSFLRAMGNQLWPGLQAADDDIAQRAARDGVTAGEFRTNLQHQYKILRRQRHG